MNNVPSPNRIMGSAIQYWQSALLLNAVKLDLFSLIPKTGATSETIASQGKFSHRQLALMLHALVAHEFLDKKGDLFFNATDVEAYLNRSSPMFMGQALNYALDLYEPWGKLDLTVREGIPAVSSDRHLGRNAEQTRHFVRAMHQRALAIGPALIAPFDLNGAKSLLDLGGGPGTLSSLLTRKYSGLCATVLDLPAVASEAELILKEQGAGDTVKVVAGSYHESLASVLGDQKFDAVLLSGQMHQESLEDSAKIVAQACKQLRPGGKLYLVDIMVSEEKYSPRFATLFGLNMCMTRPAGGVHSQGEMAQCLRDAGIVVKKHGEIVMDFPYYYFLGELN
jgi:SAM-dependent methyltransferase